MDALEDTGAFNDQRALFQTTVAAIAREQPLRSDSAYQTSDSAARAQRLQSLSSAIAQGQHLEGSLAAAVAKEQRPTGSLAAPQRSEGNLMAAKAQERRLEANLTAAIAQEVRPEAIDQKESPGGSPSGIVNQEQHSEDSLAAAGQQQLQGNPGTADSGLPFGNTLAGGTGSEVQSGLEKLHACVEAPAPAPSSDCSTQPSARVCERHGPLKRLTFIGFRATVLSSLQQVTSSFSQSLRGSSAQALVAIVVAASVLFLLSIMTIFCLLRPSETMSMEGAEPLTSLHDAPQLEGRPDRRSSMVSNITDAYAPVGRMQSLLPVGREQSLPAGQFEENDVSKAQSKAPSQPGGKDRRCSAVSSEGGMLGRIQSLLPVGREQSLPATRHTKELLHSGTAPAALPLRGPGNRGNEESSPYSARLPPARRGASAAMVPERTGDLMSASDLGESSPRSHVGKTRSVRFE